MPGNVSLINKEQQMPGGSMPITPGPGGSHAPGSMLGQGVDTGSLLTTLMLMDRLKSKNKESGGGLLSGLGGGKDGFGSDSLTTGLGEGAMAGGASYIP